MVSACLILTLAWSIKGVCTSLSVADFVSAAVGGSISRWFNPRRHLCSGGLPFLSTGTAWGTFGILIPIIIPICESLAPDLLIISLSATLAGSVFGDHCSPISDTTILSSTGAGCNHMVHVSTQIPYAITVAVCCLIGYLVAGLSKNVFLTLGASLVLLLAALFVMHSVSLKPYGQDGISPQAGK